MRCPPALTPLFLCAFLCTPQALTGAKAAPPPPLALPSFPSPGAAIEALTPGQPLPVLRQILTLLQETPALKLEIQVHTDDSFRNVWGRSPSRNRAQEIARWLIAHGTAPARLVAQGYGESKPVASNRTPEGRARNRRVVLVQLPSPPAP